MKTVSVWENKQGCQRRRYDVISLHVPRFFVFLIALAFIATNGVAARAALCQHVDAQAHAAALESRDALTAAAAHHEAGAEAAAGKTGTLADAAAASLAGLLIPPRPVVPTPVVSKRTALPLANAPGLSSRAIRPLLKPPLA